MNEQLQLKDSDLCFVYGVKEQILLERQKESDTKLTNPENSDTQTQYYYDEETMMRFVIDKSQSMTLEFDLVKKIAEKLNVDICLIQYETTEAEGKEEAVDRRDQNGDEKSERGGINESKRQPQQPSTTTTKSKKPPAMQQIKAILNLKPIKQQIYREYYLKYLQNQSQRSYYQAALQQQQESSSSSMLSPSHQQQHHHSSSQPLTKSIRIGESIHQNDLKNKFQQIQRWRQSYGLRKFEIASVNDSEASKQKILEFALLWNQEIEVKKIKMKKKGKGDKNKKDSSNKSSVYRYVGYLYFDESDIPIDVEFINKRWRRKELMKRREMQEMNEGEERQKYRRKMDSFESLELESPELQQQVLGSFKQAGIPYPKEYAFLNPDPSQIKTNKLKEFSYDGVKKSSSVKGSSSKDLDGDQNLLFQSLGLSQEATQQEAEQQSEDRKWSYLGGEEETSQERLKRERRSRYAAGLQTIEDIVTEMEELKGREYEMEAFEKGQYEKLQRQLNRKVSEMRQRRKLQIVDEE